MAILGIPLLMIWVGVKCEMPILYYVILTAMILFDLLLMAYRAGKESDNAIK